MARNARPTWSLAERRGWRGAREGRRLWGRSLLVCGQVALSLILVTVTVFMYRAFDSRLRQGPGFRTEGLIFASFDPDSRVTATNARRLLSRFARSRPAMPGVASVALASTVPMRTDNLGFSQIVPEGFTFAPGVESVNCPAALVDEG